MRRKIITSVFLFQAIFAYADPATPLAAPKGSQIQTQLRVNVKDSTKILHLISANNDPNIITKTYVLKNADPYELRAYFRDAVKAKKITDLPAKVECIKYNDGTGILIISAEDYRFEKQEQGMGFDEMVGMLDQPKIKALPGNLTYMYCPKYRDAQWLYNSLRNVGLNEPDDRVELEGGMDKAGIDRNLNALLFYIPKYQYKNIDEMLKLYDVPTSEVYLKYTVYEIDAENDGQIGVDFQAWKNGPGSDLFSVANKTGYQWDSVAGNASSPEIGKVSAKYIKFNPKWNTKYLDFLVSKGKASVMCSGELSVMNSQEGHIDNSTGVAAFQNGAKIPNVNTFEYIRLTNQTINPDGTNPATGTNDQYRFSAQDAKGNLVTINDVYTGPFNVSRIWDGTRYCYTIEMESSSKYYLVSRSQNIGNKTSCYNFVLEKCSGTLVSGTNDGTGVAGTPANPLYNYQWSEVTAWDSKQNMVVYKSNKRTSAINSYGFSLTVKPVVCEDTTNLDIMVTNTNLIGFTSDGLPRTSASEVSTQVVSPNNGGQFVIGGVEKKSLVRSASKVPFLGDIPGLGWLLGNESETAKKSQLVAFIECKAVKPENKVPEKLKEEIGIILEKTKDSTDTYNYGYDQIFLDKDKKGFDDIDL